jgi:hypothetical protein
MLTFNAETHTYYWEKIQTPSVTQIINEWMEINVYGTKYFTNRYTGLTIAADVFREAGEFGTAVHAGCRVLARGRALDYMALHPSLYHPLAEFMQWMKDYAPDFALIEEPLYSKKFHYAGTPDIVGTIKRRPIIVDIKTGAFDMAGVQLAGYEQLYRERIRRGTLHMDRYVLQLPKDGGAYKFIPCRDNGDFACFMSMWDVKRQMKGRL